MTKITKRHDDTSPDVLACLARAPVEDYEGYDYVMLTPYEAIMVQRLVSTCYERIAELEGRIEVLLAANDAWQQETDNE